MLKWLQMTLCVFWRQFQYFFTDVDDCLKEVLSKYNTRYKDWHGESLSMHSKGFFGNISNAWKMDWPHKSIVLTNILCTGNPPKSNCHNPTLFESSRKIQETLLVTILYLGPAVCEGHKLMPNSLPRVNLKRVRSDCWLGKGFDIWRQSSNKVQRTLDFAYRLLQTILMYKRSQWFNVYIPP